MIESKPLDVTLRLFKGSLIMVDAIGDSLGVWPASEIQLTALGGLAYELIIDGESLVFTKDQSGLSRIEMEQELAKELELEAELTEQGGSGTSMRPARVFRGRLERSAGSTTPPRSATKVDPPAHITEPVPNSESPHRLMSDVFSMEADQDRSHHDKFVDIQVEVVRWLTEGALSWFGFYMRTYAGSDRDRVRKANQGLEMVSKELRGIAGDVEYLAQSGSPREGLLILVYRDALEAWAAASESIGHALLIDSQRDAMDGFDLLITGTATANRIVDTKASKEQPDFLRKALLSLKRLKPPVKVSRSTVRKAKEPWEAALVAAGSPLLWEVD